MHCQTVGCESGPSSLDPTRFRPHSAAFLRPNGENPFLTIDATQGRRGRRGLVAGEGPEAVRYHVIMSRRCHGWACRPANPGAFDLRANVMTAGRFKLAAQRRVSYIANHDGPEGPLGFQLDSA
jgi:hypothetical protein